MKPEPIEGTEPEEKEPTAVPLEKVETLQGTTFAELVEQHRQAIARATEAATEAESIKEQIVALHRALAPDHKSIGYSGTTLTQKAAGAPSYGIDKKLLLRENVDPEIIKRCTVQTRKGSAPSYSITHPKADKGLAAALKPELG